MLRIFVGYLGGKRYVPGGNLFCQQEHSIDTAEWECLINEIRVVNWYGDKEYIFYCVIFKTFAVVQVQV